MLVDINGDTYNASDIRIVRKISRKVYPIGFSVLFYDIDHPEVIRSKHEDTEENQIAFLESERKRIIKAWSDSLKLGV